MRVLFLSKEGRLLPLAERVRDEGHVSTLYINDREYLARGEGIVDRPNFNRMLTTSTGAVYGNVEAVLHECTPDLVVCDRGMGSVGEIVRGKGVKTWGANKWSDIVNTSPTYAKKILDLCGIDEDKVLTQVGHQTAHNGHRGIIRLGCGAWWDGTTMKYHHVIVQEMGFMDKGVGAHILAGCVVQPIHHETRLASQSVCLLERALKKTTYVGPVYVRLSLEAGFALPAFAALTELIPKDTIETLTGDDTSIRQEYGVAVRVSMPPYPHTGESERVPFSIEAGARKHVWLVDVRDGETANVDGALGWVSCRGGDIIRTYGYRGEARRRAYRTIDNMRKNGLQELQYRTDIGAKASEILKRLESKGLI